MFGNGHWGLESNTILSVARWDGMGWECDRVVELEIDEMPR